MLTFMTSPTSHQNSSPAHTFPPWLSKTTASQLKKLTGLTFHRSSLSSHSTTSPNRPLRSGRTWLSGPVRHRVKSQLQSCKGDTSWPSIKNALSTYMLLMVQKSHNNHLLLDVYKIPVKYGIKLLSISWAKCL